MGDTVKLTVEAGKSKAVVDRFVAEEAVKILIEYRKATISKVKTLSKKFAMLWMQKMKRFGCGKKREVTKADQTEEDGEMEE